MTAKILLLDIETSPNIAYVWKFWKENVGADQIVKNSDILSFACKWLGDKEVYYFDTRVLNEKYILEEMNNFMDDADIIVTHYGNVFDIPRIRSRSLVHGILPPSPYKLIDTCLIAKREFSFQRNTLDHIAKELNVARKSEHKKFPGFKLWLGCMNNDPEAWEEMRKYNIQDVIVLEDVYLKMRPYIRNHPNVSVFNEVDEITCPKCSSTNNQKRGVYYTNVGKYQRYRCNDCGGWHRTRYTEYPKEKRKVLTTNAM